MLFWHENLVFSRLLYLTSAKMAQGQALLGISDLHDEDGQKELDTKVNLAQVVSFDIIVMFVHVDVDVRSCR